MYTIFAGSLFENINLKDQEININSAELSYRILCCVDRTSRYMRVMKST
jgi:hypothetical protein